jgi:hypothetical protein
MEKLIQIVHVCAINPDVESHQTETCWHSTIDICLYLSLLVTLSNYCIVRTRFLSTEEKLTCRLYISTESLGLRQQTDEFACWLAEAASHFLSPYHNPLIAFALFIPVGTTSQFLARYTTLNQVSRN